MASAYTENLQDGYDAETANLCGALASADERGVSCPRQPNAAHSPTRRSRGCLMRLRRARAPARCQGEVGHKAGSPADPDVQLDDPLSTDPEADVRRTADRAGWPLVAYVAIDLNYQGEVHSNVMQLSDVDLAIELGDEHIAPTPQSTRSSSFSSASGSPTAPRVRSR